MKTTPFQFRAQAEVQNHDAALGRDENVGWLEIPVQPAGLVERRHPLRQLPQAIPQAVEPGLALHDHNLTRGELLLFRRAIDLKLGERLRAMGVGTGTDIGKEIDSVDQVHCEEPVAPVRDKLPESHEVGMGDIGEPTKLLLEAVKRGRIGTAHHLERDNLLTSPVVGAIDDSHAPTADLVENLVALSLERRKIRVSLGSRACQRQARVGLFE